MNVLIVDDDAKSLKLLKVGLLAGGFRVRTAADGAEAIRLLEEEAPDAIVSDAAMPACDGFELCRAVRRDPRLAGIPIILCSALDAGANRDKALDAGASHFLQKPVPVSEIVRLLGEFGSENGARA